MSLLLEIMRFATASAVVLALYALPAGVSALLERAEPDLSVAPTPERTAAYVLRIPGLPSAIQDVPAATPTAGNAAVRAIPATRAQKPTGTAQGKRSRSREACMASTGEVRALGADRYQVERDMLDRYLRDTDAAAQLGSATWHRDGQGDVDGIRVLRVRCGSPLAEAGLARGDVVRTANGRNLDSMAGMLALWWQLRTKDEVTLEITRAGQRRTLRYSLV